LGFQKLKKQNFSPDSFGAIGTGSGVDSIGAYEIFHIKEIYQTDIHPKIIEIADKNVKALIPSNVKIETFLGDLCQPLIEKKIKVDLVYANIPNIPSKEPIFDKKKSASKFFERSSKECPEIFQKWFLTLQYFFLKEAKQILNSGGVVVAVIGARVPYKILEDLFITSGYKPSELISIYKVQTEPGDTLPGYSDQEKNSDIEFEFYDHEKALPFWKKNLENQKLTAVQIKEALEPFKINAQKALKYFKEGKPVGHICIFFKAIL
jgi:hypothetical protein